ncbi:hypothetical protein ACH5AO_13800 [Streptomyces sp. NPDC018964]|uniref:hypothetical protein n=1 Tax=unclassified Streptomyces TaxID=2593676 RepID=UPI0037953FE2
MSGRSRRNAVETMVVPDDGGRVLFPGPPWRVTSERRADRDEACRGAAKGAHGEPRGGG